MFNIDLQWLSFPVNLAPVEAWMKTNAAHYVGNSADADLTLWFSQEPDEATKEAIAAYWAGLSPSSVEAISYQTAAQVKEAIEAEQKAALSSANSKLKALGLTDAEIAALKG